LHIAVFDQFSLQKDVPQVFGNNRAVPSEEVGHLRLREPNRFPF